MNNQRPAEPSVNLFVRTLNFPFVMGKVFGVPRALQDPGSPPDAQCTLLVHELNHLHAFTTPLGRLYTALALRLKDLHDDAVILHNTWRDLAVNGDSTDHEKTLEVVDRISTAADYAMKIQTLIEYTRPLLEGLATSAEMEMTIEAQNDTASVIAAMESCHAEYLSLLYNPAKLPFIQSEAFTESIVDEFEKQLEESRVISRLINAERILFEVSPDNNGKFATAPYFFGYLYIRRLVQEWEAKAPDLSRADLYGIANTCICVVLPLTLLYSYLVEEELAPEMRRPFLGEETIATVIKSLSELEPPKLRRIREGGLLAIDLNKNGLLDVSAGNNAEHAMTSWLLAAVFPELNGAKAKETAEGLQLCERAKFFHRTYAAPSRVIGVDPTQKRVLLAHLATTTPRDGGIEADSMMWFLFKDDDDYNRFISIYASKNAKIPRVEYQSEGVFKASSSEIVVAANLSAYVIFYPTGVRTGNQFRRPMEIIWRFGPDFGSDKDIFFTQSTSIHDNKVCINWQFMNSRLLAAFNEASDTSFKRYSDPLEAIVELYQMILKELLKLRVEGAFYGAMQKKKSGESAAEPENRKSEEEKEETDEERLGNYCLRILAASKRCMERNNVEQYRTMETQCRAFYVNQIFPRYGQPDLLASRKLDVLDNHLAPADLRYLRTWLLHGAAFDKRSCFVVDEHDAPSMAATAARISSVCSNVLGVPLIRYQSESRSITLDLLKNPLPHQI